ncbi:MAG: amidohydrolase [Oscillospiraceae bacterium]|nr:amidohydrolase [Oscillospiraceae bacterium]
MLIYNARIITLDKSSTIYENGYIEFTDKITKIGQMGDCPEISEADYNAQGQTVYPGFIDAHSHIGVWENAAGFEGDDGNEVTDPCTPHLRAIDMVNPTDLCFTEAAKAGITTVAVGPGSANTISGAFLIMKTAGSPRIENRVIKSPSSMKFSFGENPKRMYYERSETPVTRMATAAIIREQLYKAMRYMDSIAQHEKDSENSLPDYDMKCESLLPLLRGEIKMHAHCHRSDDIFTAVRIAEEFKLNLVIIHGTDSAIIADELAGLNIPVLLGPIICDRGKPELLNHSIETAARLYESGVKFAITTDHPVVPAQYLPLSAGLTMRGGLSEEHALRAITVEAAEILNIADRVGTVEINKDADFTIFKGNFYEVTQTPNAVFIGGNKQ